MRPIDADAFWKQFEDGEAFAKLFLPKEILDVLLAMYADIKQRLDAMPTVKTESDWIPVTERLPEDETMMLVTCKTKKGIRSVNRAYYMNGFWHGSGSMSGVTAWKPMPEPWGGDEE